MNTALAGLAPVRGVLANGVRLMAKESRTTAAVTLHAAVHAGTIYDPPAQDGVAQFIARTIDRGTTTRSADEIAEELDSRGVSLAVSVNRHAITLVCTCLVEDFGAILSLLADIIMAPAFPESEVETRRIERAATREAAVSRLERALREGPDREVVAALAEFESAGAPFSDVLDWTTVRGVVARISLAEALRAAITADPPDTAQLARLLPAARAALGDQGMPAEPDWSALEQSVLRAAHLARLREALADGDEARIAFAAVPDPYGALSLLTRDEMERVNNALARRPHRSG